ncbi:MAG: hypothetical protein HQK83_10225 [Fibrobacteria bacterium]|nr:hypothetical protein [Fibrobacteria bacterium]
MCRVYSCVFILVLFFCNSLFAWTDGDALQLQTYLVESAVDRPDVTDGLITSAGDLDDWKAAYVRQVICEDAAIDTLTNSFFFANDDDSLYIGFALDNDDNGSNQGFFMYFDLNNNGILDGTSSEPGEYAISSIKSGNSANFTEYGWNGSAWVENTIQTPGIKQGFDDNGSGGGHLFNYEIQIPFLSSTPNAGQAFFNTEPGQEVGVMIVVRLIPGDIYWRGAGSSITDPTLWGELMINTALASPRRLASLYAKNILPVVTDGNISDDNNWRFAFDKTVAFTDFAGNKLANSRVLIKEESGNLYFGLRVTDAVNNSGDYIQVYFDQGNNGGNMNYQLNQAGSARKDDAIRVEGDGTVVDLYFNGSNWVTDGTANGSGGAYFVNGSAWEFELSKPMNSGDANDLAITSGDEVGILFRYYDADNDRDYWWSGTVNGDKVAVDMTGNFNSLGWGELVTGGPFVEPLYPEQNDIISGTYPLMIYAEDVGGVLQINSIDYRVTDLNDHIKINYSSETALTKVNNNSSGLWVTTFNSYTGSTPDDNYNIVFRVEDNDGIQVLVPLRISIQNEGEVGGPTISDMNIQNGQSINNDFAFRFEVLPSTSNILIADSIEVDIDGKGWSTVDSLPALTGGTGADTLKTSGMSDGVHTIRVRAIDNGGSGWGYSELVIFNVNNTGSIANVVITGPTDSAVVSDTLTVSYTITPPQNGSIDSVFITVDGISWVEADNSSSHKIFTPDFADDAHLIQVKAYGSNGTLGFSSPVSVIFNNAPAVAVSSIAGGDTLSGNVDITFTATSSSELSLTSLVYIDGAMADTLDGSPWSLVTGSLSDGSHSLQIKATDSKGHTGSSSLITFYADNRPVVSIAAPSGGDTVSANTNVTFTATSPAGLSLVHLVYIDGKLLDTAEASPYSLATASLSDGEHQMQLKSVDAENRVGSSAMRLFFAQNHPLVTITNPDGGDTVSGDVAIRFSINTVGNAAIASHLISLDGNTFAATDTDSSHVLATKGFVDGSHTICIKSIDENGHVGISSEMIIITRNAPGVSIVYPGPDSLVSGTLEMQFTTSMASASDSVAYVLFTIGGGVWDTASSLTGHSLDTRTYTDGSHTLMMKAVSKSGQVGEARPIKFRIRNAPSVSITTPTIDAVLNGEVIVSFTAEAVSPDKIVHTEISTGGGSWDTTTTDSTYVVPTTSFADGNLRVQVCAVDSSGKRGCSAIREFVVDNSAPKLTLPKLRYAPEYNAKTAGTSFLVTALAFDLTAGMDNDSGVVFMFEDSGSVSVLSIDTSVSPPDTQVSLLSNELSVVTSVLLDDGKTATKEADSIKGDNVFSAYVHIPLQAAGTYTYTLRARDAIGNDTTITGELVLDTKAPEVGYTFTPVPEQKNDGADSIHGDVYKDAVVLKGWATDEGSGLSGVTITVRNDSGLHINNSPMDVVLENGKFSRIIDLVPGINTITLIAEDMAGHVDSLQGTLNYQLPKVTEVVKTSGGKVVNPNKSSVDIPEDALFSSTEITIRVVDPDEEPDPLEINNQQVQLLGTPHEFGPDGTVFRKKVKVTLPYTDLDLDVDQDMKPDFGPEDLKVYFYDGDVWRVAGIASVDTAAQTVSVEVNHFTMFDIGADTSSNGGIPETFEAYWTKNPVKQNETSLFEVAAPLAGVVSLKIFDMAGDLVKTITDNESIDAGIVNYEWDGQNVNGGFAGAGLYIYVLKYQSNNGSIKKLIRKPVGLLRD